MQLVVVDEPEETLEHNRKPVATIAPVLQYNAVRENCVASHGPYMWAQSAERHEALPACRFER